MKNKIIIFTAILVMSFLNSKAQYQIPVGDTTINIIINTQQVDDVKQVTKDDTSLVRNFKLNFAVPDQPAFKVLGTESSNILRPSSSEVVSLVTSNFLQGITPVLPNSFSMELAPLMLIKSNSLTLQEYDKNSILYSTRISIGTSLGNKGSNSRNLGLGARVTLIDKGDLKNDAAYREQLYKLTANLVADDNRLKQEWLKANDLTIQEVVTNDSLNNAMEAYIETESIRYNGKSFQQRLAILKKDYRTKNWNKQKLDVAAAVLLNSEDSLIKNLKYNSTEVWVTYALPVKTWGQLLIGLNYANVNHYTLLTDTFDIAVANNVSISSRLYGGTNRFKGFLEAQYELSATEFDNIHTILINGGSEFNITDGIWIGASLGVDMRKDKTLTSFNSNVVGNIDIKFTLPENFRFF